MQQGTHRGKTRSCIIDEGHREGKNLFTGGCVATMQILSSQESAGVEFERVILHISPGKLKEARGLSTGMQLLRLASKG